MAKASREGFRPQPIDRTNTIDLPTGDLPERVSVDLDNADGNAFTVVEVDDTPEADRGRPTDVADLEPVAGDSPNVAKRIARLKAETHTERRAREEVERREAAAIELLRSRDAELADLRKRLEGSTGALAASMKSDREARLADARARLERAHAEGDSAAVASATADMGMVQAELVQIAARTPAARQAEPERQPAAQPAHQAPNLAPAVAAWISKNDSWFNKDGAKTKLALSLHDTIVQRGIQPTDPRYTQELDKGMKAMYSDHVAYDTSQADDDGGTPTPRRTNVVADGSRETGKVSNPRIVELTKSQLAIAKQLNITPQQYAASLAKYAPAQRNGA